VISSIARQRTCCLDNTKVEMITMMNGTLGFHLEVNVVQSCVEVKEVFR
jgi:hypothetical protein